MIRKETVRASWAAPVGLMAVIVIMTGVIGYHALDSWYLQAANAIRLKADYSDIAAIRFNAYAEADLSARVAGKLDSIRSGNLPGGNDVSPAFTFMIPLNSGQPVFSGSIPPAEVRQELARAVRTDAMKGGSLSPFRSLSVRGSTILYSTFLDSTGAAVLAGFLFNAADYTETFRDIFAGRSLLPSGMRGAEMNASSFTIQVSAREGGELFRSGQPLEDDYVARLRMDERFGGITSAVSARKSSVAWLATEHLASRMALILLLSSLAALVSILSVRLMRRETRLMQAHSRFVSSVSHELRTPLAQIQVFLETLRLQRFSSNSEREWLFDGMQREITRLTSLVNNVLQFSHAQRGESRGTTHLETVDLSTFLNDVLSSFAPLAAVDSVLLDTSDIEECHVAVSRDPFRQVVLNLLDNAVKYGPEGQVIRVATERMDGRCRIIIDDQGPGVPEEERMRVWEQFQRGSNAGRTTTGSGIGLSVVREIVVAHGGSVSIADAPGGGARFIVDLPAADPLPLDARR